MYGACLPLCPILTHGYLFCHPLTALDTTRPHLLPPPLKGLSFYFLTPLYLFSSSLNVFFSPLHTAPLVLLTPFFILSPLTSHPSLPSSLPPSLPPSLPFLSLSLSLPLSGPSVFQGHVRRVEEHVRVIVVVIAKVDQVSLCVAHRPGVVLSNPCPVAQPRLQSQLHASRAQ